MFKAVGHQKIHFGTKQTQAFHGHSASSRAIGIVVGNDEQAFACVYRRCQLQCGGIDVFEVAKMQQVRQVMAGFGNRFDVTRGIQLCQQWADACGL